MDLDKILQDIAGRMPLVDDIPLKSMGMDSDQVYTERLVYRIPGSHPVRLSKDKKGRVYFYLSGDDQDRLRAVLSEIRGRYPGMTGSEALMRMVHEHGQ